MISHIILPVFPMRPVVREGSGSTRRVGATVDPPPDRDRMLEEMKWLGGKIFMTSLSHEDEARLQAALSATKIGRLVGLSGFPEQPDVAVCICIQDRE